MNLLQLIGVTDTTHSCAECTRLVRPAILAHNNGSHAVGYHCFRCYHILSAIQVFQRFEAQNEPVKGGA